MVTLILFTILMVSSNASTVNSIKLNKYNRPIIIKNLQYLITRDKHCSGLDFFFHSRLNYKLIQNFSPWRWYQLFHTNSRPLTLSPTPFHSKPLLYSAQTVTCESEALHLVWSMTSVTRLIGSPSPTNTSDHFQFVIISQILITLVYRISSCLNLKNFHCCRSYDWN